VGNPRAANSRSSATQRNFLCGLDQFFLYLEKSEWWATSGSERSLVGIIRTALCPSGL